jgi:membrane protein implicated in regulation of membrane protease activity
MRQPGSLRQFGIYLLLQIPGYVLAGLLLGLLVERDWLSVGWAILALLGWVGKDLALYPAMRRVFQPSRVGSEALLGAPGVVEAPLDPRGLVRIGSELWRGEPLRRGERLPAGMRVVVRDIRGLTVYVEPSPPASA